MIQAVPYTPQTLAGNVFPKTGAYVVLTPGVGTNTSATIGNGNLTLAPLIIQDAVTLVRIGCEVTIVGDAASTFTIAIYGDLGPGAHYPNALLFDSSATGSASTILANGLISGNSATVQEITVAWTLTPGLYWVGGVLQGVTVTQPTFRCPVTPTWQVATGTTIPAANTSNTGFKQASVTGALPGTFSSTVTPQAAGVVRIFGKT